MNIKIKIFASLRETLGVESMSLTLPGKSAISAVIEQLGQEHGELWRETLGGDQVLFAVNQTLVEVDHLLKADDELAFLPPVTGG